MLEGLLTRSPSSEKGGGARCCDDAEQRLPSSTTPTARLADPASPTRRPAEFRPAPNPRARRRARKRRPGRPHRRVRRRRGRWGVGEPVERGGKGWEGRVEGEPRGGGGVSVVGRGGVCSAGKTRASRKQEGGLVSHRCVSSDMPCLPHRQRAERIVTHGNRPPADCRAHPSRKSPLASSGSARRSRRRGRRPARRRLR